MSATEPDFTIFSDASLSGLGGGAVLNEVSSRGPYTLNDKNIHISELELLAALNGLKSFTSQVSNLSVRLMLHNFTAVHYINKLGGTKSPALSAISADIVNWCEKRKLSIKAIHLPGVLNVFTYQQSRMRNESSDWELQESTFQRILTLWEPEIASTWNKQLDRFVSWKPQPVGIAVDAFSLSWTNRRGYAFPPFHMIARCRTKIMKEKGRFDSSGTGLASATVVPPPPYHLSGDSIALGSIN